MKNIHILPTDNKPSRLYFNINDKEFQICEIEKPSTILKPNRHIYITSNEEIKEGEYGLSKLNEIIKFHSGYDYRYYTKIILTTDQDLIKDSVQAIDDDFLEWFVKNPSCEEGYVEKDNYLFCKHCDTLHSTFGDGINCDVCRKESNPYMKTFGYKITIPKEEPKQDLEKEMFELEEQLDIPSHLRWHNSKPKQETLEEAAREYYKRGQLGFEAAADTERAFLIGGKWQQERSYSEEEVLTLVDNLFHKYSSDFRVSAKIDTKEWFEQFKKK